MDFTALAGSLARAGLPALATILGAVVPPPFDLMVAPAFALIRGAMGLPDTATPTDVQTHVDADPRAAQARLHEIDAAHAAAATELQAYLADMQNARATTVQLAASGSRLAWGSPVISTVVVVAFAIVAIVVFARYGVESAVGQLIAGALIAKFGTVVDFWLGSSKGSAERSDAVLSMLHQALGLPAQAAPVSRRTGR